MSRDHTVYCISKGEWIPGDSDSKSKTVLWQWCACIMTRSAVLAAVAASATAVTAFTAGPALPGLRRADVFPMTGRHRVADTSKSNPLLSKPKCARRSRAGACLAMLDPVHVTDAFISLSAAAATSGSAVFKTGAYVGAATKASVGAAAAASKSGLTLDGLVGQVYSKTHRREHTNTNTHTCTNAISTCTRMILADRIHLHTPRCKACSRQCRHCLL